MSSLQTIQQQMLQAVLAERAAKLRAIRSDDIADAGQRLSVYHHGYRVRLHDALKNEFTGLQCMTGRRFHALLDTYVKAHPSEHYNIRWYGADLPSFLDETHPWCDEPQLAEMAYVDWAISTAFDAEDEYSVGMADLSAVPPHAWANLRLSMQKHLRVITVTHNVDAFRRAADGGAKRPRLRRFARARQILVWRKGTTVHFRTLDHDEWQVLSAALDGETFAAMCQRLANHHDESAAMSRMVLLLQRWLEAGLIHGWTTD
jgi:Putative DNA-binding domain